MKSALHPVIIIGSLIILVIASIPEANASYALEVWNMETRRNVPLLTKLWLGAMMIANLSSVFFIKRHIAARWVFGALILSHSWIAILEITGLYAVKGGQVSLGHILFWSPAIFMLIKFRSEMKLPSAYAIWASIMLFFYGVSLVFDIRDAAIWMSSLF